MASAAFRKEKFSFRFTHLSQEASTRLQTTLPEVAFTSKRPDVMVWKDLRENTDFTGLYRFLQSERLDPNSYGVWIAVVSSSDHDGIAVPKYILDLIRKTDCGIDFSFVACLNGEETASSELSDLS